MAKDQQMITICSDSTGETGEGVVKATLRQFNGNVARIRRVGHIRTDEEVTTIVEQVASEGGFIAYTLVQPELREMLKQEAIRLGVRAVDIMGPMMQAYIDTFNGAPSSKPGLLHQLDEDYFKRVEAIEFTVKCDDGRDTASMLKADIVLIGISRTSKTPLSIFLAHKGYKVANFPLVPEVKIPAELYQVDRAKIIGLTMDPEYLLKIRTERLKTLGLPFGSQYSSYDRILEEMDHAHSLMKQLHCPIIDVSNKAIEETAGIIMNYL
ncbi:kinase/pyrophosphorylase [Paenibacillus sp. N1-5-1-14]|uniref:pyruvate, water dikinase regulatory protein n=1 Tax=Paenibacillus radicibacter TaxID=2972488 RepID=UPI002158DEDD|nr:pyruvate, water dikinase regulatory protein [Paenibacillus radicibacter]MCR8644049.1 kinase/pyrophosphorylase [Paenibacillus radicibacter]